MMRVLFVTFGLAVIATLTIGSSHSQAESTAVPEKQVPDTSRSDSGASVTVLLLVDTGAGANYDIDDTIPSIKEQFEAFGWKTIIAGLSSSVVRCDYSKGLGLRELRADYLISAIPDSVHYDIVCLPPNNNGLARFCTNDTVLNLIRSAVDSGLVVAAWCKSVRVLAAAGVINGLDVVGHADYKSEYEAAGAKYLGNDHPPVIQGNIVTSVRSRFYRRAMCEAMREALTAQRSRH